MFASVAIGMGINLQGVNIILHYGAPSSIEDYFQVRINTHPVIFFKIGCFLLFIEKFHVIAKITLFAGIGKLLAAFFFFFCIIIRLLRIQYKTAIAEACDYFLNSMLDKIARWKK